MASDKVVNRPHSSICSDMRNVAANMVDYLIEKLRRISEPLLQHVSLWRLRIRLSEHGYKCPCIFQCEGSITKELIRE